MTSRIFHLQFISVDLRSVMAWTRPHQRSRVGDATAPSKPQEHERARIRSRMAKNGEETSPTPRHPDRGHVIEMGPNDNRLVSRVHPGSPGHPPTDEHRRRDVNPSRRLFLSKIHKNDGGWIRGPCISLPMPRMRCRRVTGTTPAARFVIPLFESLGPFVLTLNTDLLSPGMPTPLRRHRISILRSR